jgi:site-specific recombinase XerD
VDFPRNPHAREFGRFGQLQVRYGKAHAGSAPKRRSVLTVRRWSAEVVEHWITRGLPQFGDGLDLFPTERGTLVSEAALSGRFRRYRDDVGLDDRLDMHSFRRSYVTHLREDGIDAMFVQHQVGHEHASTTALALYSCVSSDYRTRTLRHALDTCLNEALATKSSTEQPRSGS